MDDDTFEVTLSDGSTAWFAITGDSGKTRDIQSISANWGLAKPMELVGHERLMDETQHVLAAEHPEVLSHTGSAWVFPDGAIRLLYRGGPGQRAYVSGTHLKG